MKHRSLLLSPSLLVISVFFFHVQDQATLAQTPQEQPVQAQTDSLALQPYAAAGITEAFSFTSTLISEGRKQNLSNEVIDNYTIQLDTLFYEINGFLGDSSIITLDGISVRELDQISERSRAYMGRIDALHNRFSGVAMDLESESARILQNRTRWQLTLDSRTEEEVPELRTERIELTIVKLDSVRSLLQEDLALMLEGVDLLADKKLELEDVTERTKGQKGLVGENLLKIEMPGFFKELSTLGDTTLFSSHVEKFKNTIKTDYGILKLGYKRALIIAALFLVGLLIFSLWFKKNYARLISQENFKLSEMHMTIINSPIVTTVFVITVMTRFLLPDLPQAFASLNGVIMMVPMAILWIRFVGTAIRTWIIVLVVVYGIALLYELSYHPGVLLRIILMGICFAGIWLFYWTYRNKPFSVGFKNKAIYSLFRGLILVFAGFQFIAIIANLVGAFQLAEFLTLLPIQITIVAVGILLAIRLADAIVYLALSSNYLQKINVIKEDVQVIHKKIAWLVELALWLFFFSMMLKIFLIRDFVFEWGKGVLTDGRKIGAVDITLGNILIFFFVIWLSVMITRIVTRILEKDVFTRVTTAKGIPSTIIMLLRIALISGGFFLAAAAAGIKLNNLTIVLGAFSVGIGFGLQNIFNNIVSGLILAFERPIKVGDVVQVGELVGTVKSIGLRSSNVRSFDGAEVIVPNGNLISNQMTNWTKSDYYRRMDIRVGVTYGTDPEEVLKLMEEVATEHPDVRKIPAPYALFIDFGDSSLNFRLLAWVHLDIRLTVESKLKVIINTKLKEAGIEIPFPQRDLHIRSDATKPGSAAKPAVKPKPGTGRAKK